MLRLANFFMRLEARLSYALIGLVQATGYAGGLDLCRINKYRCFSLYKTGYSPNVIFPREDEKDRT